MKIIFASFQGINKKNVPEGMTRLVIPILKYFPDNDGYFISYSSVNNEKVKVLSPFHIFIRKIIGRISQIFKLHYGVTRLYQEFMYDFFLSFRIKKATILFSTAYIPKTALKNKKFGGINIFLAGNPYDRHINNILVSEKNKFNLNFEDAYTYEKRLLFLDNFLDVQDYIITQTSITYESFLITHKPTRLSLQEVHILPNKKQFENVHISKSHKLRFVYIAHTVWLKGLIYLIEAWNKLAPSDCELIIGGNIHPIVKIEIEKYKNKNIEFIGSVYGKELNQFFRQAHICIVPSLVDDHPATISEALYCGLPVITTEGCGSKTLIKDGENGFIVPVADADAIAKKIQWFIDNQDKIEEMSIKAKQSIEDIENSDQNEILASHIMEVIEKLEKEKSMK